MRILVADDSQHIHRFFLDLPQSTQSPFRISSTDNGRDCLTFLNAGLADLAFIDVHLPDLSGTEALWAARTRGNRTFVTLMSSPPAQEAFEMAVKLRAYEFLFKPFGACDVLNIIKTYDRITNPSRVLVVDDSATIRQLVKKVIGGSMFTSTVAEAADGETALALCRDAKFDVIFLDCNMPGISGLNTMRKLLAIHRSLKIVMMSAANKLATEDEAIDSGACAFLHEPFNSADVDRVLHIAYGLRWPNLRVKQSGSDFDVAIEGGTIRLAHKTSGHVFEYSWSDRPPHLRNAVIRAAPASPIAAVQLAAIAEKTAVGQLSSARLIVAH
ncbi:MAG: response regulator [Pseudolabrys sp.]|nr:response regulator [Pseudolabrys sp.]